ncbi:hypothetical protein AgCh_029936 [Apium graveolens]
MSGMPECKLGLNDRVLLEVQGRSTKGKAIDLDNIKFRQIPFEGFSSVVVTSSALGRVGLHLKVFQRGSQLERSRKSGLGRVGLHLKAFQPCRGSHLERSRKSGLGRVGLHLKDFQPCAMPECKLGLNDRVLLEVQGRSTKGKAIDLDDIKFHQCVRLARFENDRTISFIPPDGSFDVMTYRLSTQVKPLIWVEAQVERHSRSRIELTVKAKSQFKERSTATHVEIELPVPSDSSNPNIRTSMGSASYAPESDSLIRKIKSFPGGKEYMLRAEFSLPSITDEEAAPERKASHTLEI